MQAVLATPFLNGREVLHLRRDAVDAKDGVIALVRSIVAMADQPAETSAFYVLDLDEVVELFDAWRRGLNGAVRPYYAVKCNPNPALLAALAALGSGFDCASPAEMEAVLAVGVTADRIIYANPCKPESHIKYAARVGVNVTTFDSVYEVQKIRRFHPRCALLLRLKAPDDDGNSAMLNLGTKYGAHQEEVVPLLCAAWRAGLSVAGVSFHAGSAVSRPRVYGSAIEAARAAFDAAAALGMPPMRVLDIGGGFKARSTSSSFSSSASTFQDACAVINAALARHFGDIPGIELIAKPGRYFAETPFALAARIFGKRARGDAREYWIDGSMFGTLCCVHFENYMPRPAPVACRRARGTGVGGDRDDVETTRTRPSTVFGPTLDSLDVVVREYPLPELCTGDWLVFHDIGAYTTVLSSDFSGFSTSRMKTYLASSSSV